MFEHHRPSRVLLCCALALLFVGCAARSAAKPSQGLERIVAKGVIRVGTSGEQPPLTMTARNGNLIGLDIALSRVLAQSMGVDAEFVKLPFGRLLPALESGDVDIVMSGMTINPSRSQRVTFVGPYYTSGKALLTRSEEIAAAGVILPSCESPPWPDRPARSSRVGRSGRRIWSSPSSSRRRLRW